MCRNLKLDDQSARMRLVAPTRDTTTSRYYVSVAQNEITSMTRLFGNVTERRTGNTFSVSLNNGCFIEAIVAKNLARAWSLCMESYLNE